MDKKGNAAYPRSYGYAAFHGEIKPLILILL